MNIRPVSLAGTIVKLEPLSLAHHAQLCDVGLNPDLWKFTTAEVKTPEDMLEYITSALKLQAGGTALPFAIIDKSLDKAIGSTRYGNIDTVHRRLEIGWTWIGKKWQRTKTNTETKYLLLKHAFDKLGCIRVEFKTDSLNQQSRSALLRIGAKEEGILRNHMITSTGRIRHSVYYSIIDSEWEDAGARLIEKISA